MCLKEVNDQFQGMCLLDVNGSKTIIAYDELPKHVRNRIADSPFNLCPYCIVEHGRNYFECIEKFEDMIRANDTSEHD